jgi:hypothetical protein
MEITLNEKPQFSDFLKDLTAPLEDFAQNVWPVANYARLNRFIKHVFAHRAGAEEACLNFIVDDAGRAKNAEHSQRIGCCIDVIADIVAKYFPDARLVAKDFLLALVNDATGAEYDEDSLIVLFEELKAKLGLPKGENNFLFQGLNTIDFDCASPSINTTSKTPVGDAAKVLFLTSAAGQSFGFGSSVDLYYAVYDIASNTLYTDLTVNQTDEYICKNGIKGAIELSEDASGCVSMTVGSSIVVKKFSEYVAPVQPAGTPFRMISSSSLKRDSMLKMHSGSLEVKFPVRNFFVSWEALTI